MKELKNLEELEKISDEILNDLGGDPCSDSCYVSCQQKKATKSGDLPNELDK